MHVDERFSVSQTQFTSVAPTIGSMARHTGRLGAGHAAWVALINEAGVITSRPDQIRVVLGDGWEVLEV